MKLTAMACALVLAAIGLAEPAAARDLPTPRGEVILSVTGAIANTNDGAAAKFDLGMLEGLSPVTFETTTTWTDGPQSFTGVPLARLMEAVGAKGTRIQATAINDYSVEIPRADWVEGGPIIAYLNNGAPMSIRERGPLWIVYPYDTKPEYQSEVIYSRSIWQLDRIVVKE
jgi:hypothetical protein